MGNVTNSAPSVDQAEDVKIQEKPKKMLHFSNKELKSFPDLSQTNLSELETIYLDNNEISNLQIDKKVLEKIKQKLNKVSVYKNKISEIPEEFCELTNLESVAFDMNLLSAFPLNFQNLKRLKEITLNLNLFKTFDVSFTNIEILDVSNNQLSFIDVSEMKKLRFLNLSSNKYFEFVKNFKD
jgi:leucine-rich repeat protein SHOC2